MGGGCPLVQQIPVQGTIHTSGGQASALKVIFLPTVSRALKVYETNYISSGVT